MELVTSVTDTIQTTIEVKTHELTEDLRVLKRLKTRTVEESGKSSKLSTKCAIQEGSAFQGWHYSEDNITMEFNEDLVFKIYTSELGGGVSSAIPQCLKQLEFTRYLEQYLWLHFAAGKSSTAHVLSIIMIVNEKFRRGVSAWEAFRTSTPEKFAAFFRQVVALNTIADLSVLEKTEQIIFLGIAFQSLEEESIRSVALPFVGLSLWANLSPVRRQEEFSKNMILKKHWRHMVKKKKSVFLGVNTHYLESSSSMTNCLEASWLPALVQNFLEISRCTEGDEEILHAIKYCERFVEFIIDLLSQLPTRRFVRTLLDDIQLLVKSRLAPLSAQPAGQLYRQLVELFCFYQEFSIDDHTGLPLDDDTITSSQQNRLIQLQHICFKHVKKLRKLALSHCGAIESRSVLTYYLSALSEQELHKLVTSDLQLVNPEDSWASNQSFLFEVVLNTFEKRSSQRQIINGLSLFPSEDLLWDENIVPSAAYSGGDCLALPKLNLQFLTFHDYLFRNFTLSRLQATYEVHKEISDAVRHLSPYEDTDAKVTKFAGWSRMAAPISPRSFVVTDVRKSKLGENKPTAVTCELIINFSSLRLSVQKEWDLVKQHDVLFLLAVEGLTDARLEEKFTRDVQERTTASSRRGGKLPYTRLGEGVVTFVRGAEVIEIRDRNGKPRNSYPEQLKPEEPTGASHNEERTLVLALDTAQYLADTTELTEGHGFDVYAQLNVVLRRKPKENNFKAVLECIRDLMNCDSMIPDWLHDTFLGFGDPAATKKFDHSDDGYTVDFQDTFLDADHLRDSFDDYDVVFKNAVSVENPEPFFRISFPPSSEDANSHKKRFDSIQGSRAGRSSNSCRGQLFVEPYTVKSSINDIMRNNEVRFTSVQVKAIHSAVQPGLTMVVGPPGTGKTDTATQILQCLYHNDPEQRTLLITHSNAALNDLFQKLMKKNIPARYLLRLGQGESELDTDMDFSRFGRVEAMLSRRVELLAEVEKLALSLGIGESVAYSCESAHNFWTLHVLSRWETFEADASQTRDLDFVRRQFPFTSFFGQDPLSAFPDHAIDANMAVAQGFMNHIRAIFLELEECRAFELLKEKRERANYLLTKQAKVVAMTCTYAALKRRDFIRLGFKYDSLIMEEAAQILEIDTCIPMFLQRSERACNRLKRVVLFGDHHQLPPIVKNSAFQKYCNLEQSLFARFIRLGVPYIELNAQGRARPELSSLYSWRYNSLGDLPSTERGTFALANPGFAHEVQFVNVDDFNGAGETEPTPHFYQNLGEAEYIVSVFQYMRLLGYPAHKISIITTYRGQKHLIRDIIARRCSPHPLFGSPAAISTVDKYQGRQNDYVLLSLVRSKSVGHLRDVRRLIVALSRARLGLYIFGRRSLFQDCYELRPSFAHLLKFPTRLSVVPTELYPPTRSVSKKVTPYLVNDVEGMGLMVNQLAVKLQQERLPTQTRCISISESN